MSEEVDAPPPVPASEPAAEPASTSEPAKEEAATVEESAGEGSAMHKFLVEVVGLKGPVADSVETLLVDELEVEDPQDFKHVSEEDIQMVITKCGLKKVSASKLTDAWKKATGKVDEPKSHDASGARRRGFLPGYSDVNTDGTSLKRGCRLMYLSEEQDEGGRSLIIDEDKTTELFEAMSGDALLITVFGPARCGKSFLMNLLCGHKDLFEIGHGNRPCTQGVFISELFEDGATFQRRLTIQREESTRFSEAGGSAPTLESLEEDAPMEKPPTSPTQRKTVRKSFADSSSVAFVDVEGLGDKGKAYDVHLIAPLLLLSKVLIYNWKGAPNKHVMLDSLLTLGEAAQRVNTSSDDKGPIFGHLVILLRDWHSTEDVHDLLFKKEDEPSRGDDAIRARNRARDLVLEAFESITVECLPFPGYDPQDQELSELSADFVDRYLDLHSQLVDLSQNPKPVKLFSGRSLDGETIATLLPMLAKQLNEDQDLLPKELWRLMEEHRLHSVMEDNKKEIKEWIEAKVKDEMPTTIPRIELMGEDLRTFGNKDQMELLDLFTWLSPETAAETKSKYAEFVEEQVQLLLVKNNNLRNELSEKAKGIISQLSAAFAKTVDVTIKPNLPFDDKEELANEISQIREQTMGELELKHEDLIKQTKDVLEMDMASSLNEEMDRTTEQVTTKNDNMIIQAESLRLHTHREITDALAELVRKSADTPTPLSQLENEISTLLEGKVLAVISRATEIAEGRAEFGDREGQRLRELVQDEVTRAKAEHDGHVRNHLRTAADSVLNDVKSKCTEKQADMPLKGGELEIWITSTAKGGDHALSAVCGVLQLTLERGHSGFTGDERAVETQGNLANAIEMEMKQMRAKNQEAMRRVACPESGEFANFTCTDGMITVSVVVPQPNQKFALPVNAIQIERKPSPEGVITLEVASEKVLNHAYEGLTNGKPYEFRVRCQNENGWSGWSKHSTAVPVGPPPPPMLKDTKPVKGGLKVTIDPATAGNGGAPIIAYMALFSGKNGHADQQEISVDSNDQDMVIVKGLENGVEYSITMKAKNEKGFGAESQPIKGIPAPLPDQPVVATVTGINGGLRVHIAPPTPHDGDEISLISQYHVTCRAQVGAYPEVTQSFVPHTSRSHPPPEMFTMSGLTNGVTYEVTVEAENGIGLGPASEPQMGRPRGNWLFSLCSGPGSSTGAIKERPSGASVGNVDDIYKK